MTKPRVKYADYAPRGEMRALFIAAIRKPPAWREVLLVGPAGTGKTRAVCELDHYLCEQHDGLRVLWVRNTRIDMAETVLRTFEDLVLTDDHPLLATPRKRSHRESYDYPNGSKIVMGGMNNPHKFRSGEYDLIRVFEASEVSEPDYEMLLHRLRAGTLKTPDGRVWTQILCDTNPDAPGHWLNIRAESGRMHRLCTTHKDNPAYWDVKANDWTAMGREYVVDTLGRLTGVRRARYLEGRWSAAEGAIYPEWSRAKHVVTKIDHDLRWAFAAVDWGYRGAGVITVFGVDAESNAYIVREVYRRNVLIPEWVDIAKRLVREVRDEHNVDLTEFVCDPAEPVNIAEFKRAGLNAREAVNDIMPGLDSVRKRLAAGTLVFMADANRERDEELWQETKVASAIHEIESYVYLKTSDGKPIKEKPDPACVDHGMDTWRYGCMHLDRRGGFERPAKKIPYPKGSYGDIFKLDEDMERERMIEKGWVSE